MTAFDDMLQNCLDPVPASWPVSERRNAAVLCPIVDRNGVDHALFTVRPGNLRRHAGQIGFPGGMQEPDETPATTALRECHEEIGVPADAVRLLGAVATRESSSRIDVHCLVGRVAPVELVLAADEVERVIFVPMPELLDRSRWAHRPPPIRVKGTKPPTSPHFRFGDDLLWGLTGRFVFELVTRVDGPDHSKTGSAQ